MDEEKKKFWGRPSRRNDRPMTPEQQERYEELVKGAEQMELDIEALLNEPTVYGYARVSTKKQAKDGNSLEAQEAALKAAGAEKVYSDAFTGTTANRPQLDRLMSVLRHGDTLIVTKLDRIARSTMQGLQLVRELVGKGVTVNVLNMGTLSDKPEDALRLTMFLAFAQYERDMILQRTREGKEIARQHEGFREGRPKKYTQAQVDHAVDLLGIHSYSEVVEMTGISKSTLIRAVKYAKTISERKKKE